MKLSYPIFSLTESSFIGNSKPDSYNFCSQSSLYDSNCCNLVAYDFILLDSY